MYPDGKAEGVCEEDGSVHWVHRTVPDVEQCSCVVEAQVAARRDYKPVSQEKPLKEYVPLFKTRIRPRDNSPF